MARKAKPIEIRMMPSVGTPDPALFHLIIPFLDLKSIIKPAPLPESDAQRTEDREPTEE